ncbi:phospholipid methyltransferase [Ascodesmis nigricans]|uniref:Phosphatidyl-N-methylethanolamine N-methyltransferase n=1 Tax=Ascodesmis nigricans TaxID=341454 RepID=A0A4S2MT85_9PEZI|nr:phospholipid methyltransferase [Ascodesmis nigricans]
MTQIKVWGKTAPQDLVDFSQTSLLVSLGSIAFNPVFWNIIARQEYHNKVLTKVFGGNSRYGCYFLAVVIFSIGIIRDYFYEQALRDQPALDVLLDPTVKYLAGGFFLVGNVLVITSMYALGVTGTYLGDYFGILMDHRVTSFPFNVTDSPMYTGSTLSFLGTALWFGKPAGLFISAFVYIMYQIALTFEDPFTAEIYAKRERERAKKRG